MTLAFWFESKEIKHTKTAKVTMTINIIGEPATPLTGAALSVNHHTPEIAGDSQLVVV